MWAPRRDEALRRAVETAELAEAARAEARHTRQVAAQDEDARASLERSAAELDAEAKKHQRSADTYLDIVWNFHPIQQDDDADGYW